MQHIRYAARFHTSTARALALQTIRDDRKKVPENVHTTSDSPAVGYSWVFVTARWRLLSAADKRSALLSTLTPSLQCLVWQKRSARSTREHTCVVLEGTDPGGYCRERSAPKFASEPWLKSRVNIGMLVKGVKWSKYIRHLRFEIA